MHTPYTLIGVRGEVGKFSAPTIHTEPPQKGAMLKNPLTSIHNLKSKNPSHDIMSKLNQILRRFAPKASPAKVLNEYIAFHVTMLHILDNGNAVFMFDGAEEQGFTYVQAHTKFTERKDTDCWGRQNREWQELEVKPSMDGNYRFIIDAGFYAECHFCLDANGKESKETSQGHRNALHKTFSQPINYGSTKGFATPSQFR